MSSFGGLNVALSSLMAQRRAMDVTGQNIANANTVGFTRQRADLQPLGPSSLYSLQGTNQPIGGGVTVAGISRLGDELASSRLRGATGESGYLDFRAEALTQLEARFAEPGDTGLSTQLAELWATWDDVANNPGQPAARQALVEQSVSVVDSLRSGHAGVAAQWSQTRGRAVSLESEVNTLATGVAELNRQIRTSKAVDGNASELTDQRDQLVLRLSTLTGATGGLQDDGTMHVLIGGVPLVDGDRAHAVRLAAPLRLQDVTAAAPVRFTWADGSPAAFGGQAGAVTETLQTTLPGAAAGYDAVAVALADGVNGLHRDGRALDGSTGRDFFVFSGGAGAAAITVNQALVDDGRLVAAGAAGGGVNDGTGADAIASLRGSTSGPDAVWSAFVVRTGVQAGAVTQRANVAADVVATAEAQLQSVTGVDIDEEMTNLLMFQRAYEGAARVLTAVDQALDTLINRTGLVGR